MNKKGFTLIELLAVIVILAIIAVIAVPIVLNIINDSKDNATLRSADFYLDAVEMSVAQASLRNKNVPDGTYNIKDGDICLNEACTDILEVEVNGEVPKTGTITISNGNIDGLNIVLDGKVIYKNSKGELVYTKFLEDICKSAKDQLYSSTPKTAGYKYECKVDPNKDPYTFYVLNTPGANDKSINLIMDSNINSTGEAVKSSSMNDKGNATWISMSYLEEHASEDDLENYKNLNIYGPITAMEYLQKATKDWVNTNEQMVSIFTDEAGEEYEMAQAFAVNARLPYLNEVELAGCSVEGGCPNWMIDYLADEEYSVNAVDDVWSYWMLSASGKEYHAWHVYYDGSIRGNGYVYDAYGIRPVITLDL